MWKAHDTSIEVESKLVLAGNRIMEWLLNGYMVSFQGEENTLELYIGDGLTALWIP